LVLQIDINLVKAQVVWYWVQVEERKCILVGMDFEVFYAVLGFMWIAYFWETYLSLRQV